MKIFIFGGPDSSSDDGYFRIIVQAGNKVTAKKWAGNLLKEWNREDLLPVMELRATNPSIPGVVWHSVQSR